MAKSRSEASDRGRRSSRRGSAAERQVAGFLRTWWSQIEPFVQFVRTPRSGGWRHAAEYKARGDVMTMSSTFPFVVEVKCRAAWSMKNFLDGKASPVWAWWKQAQRDAEAQGGVPLLIFRRPGSSQWFALLPREFVEDRRIVPVYDFGGRVEADCGVQPVGFPLSVLLEHHPEWML